LAACIPQGIVKSRLDIIEDFAPCKTPATALIVFLPGLYDTPEDLVRQGFVSALRRRNLAADIVMADANIGYYKSGLVVRRLHEDIILPARQKGYRQIWLTGISLGGYGSLLYAKHHSELISGIFLMAPYLGNRDLLQEVSNTGGLANWQAGDIPPADFDRELWAWLQNGYGRTRAHSVRAYPSLYIGYGVEDRFAGSNQMLANALPQTQVMTTEGGHDWPPWRRLWGKFLDRKLLPECA
jgi:pimeloyl-ACP methyl ester carboxylesterase